MKTIQIVQHGEGILSLNDQGQIHYGFWIQREEGFTHAQPLFMWRRLPDIPDDAYTFQLKAEPTQKQLDDALALMLENAKKNPSSRPPPLPPSSGPITSWYREWKKK